MRGDERRLSDIIDAIEQIDRYAARGKDAFDTEELVQVWMLHHLEIIGEALRSMSDEFRATYKDRWDWGGWIGLQDCHRSSILPRPAADYLADC